MLQQSSKKYKKHSQYEEGEKNQSSIKMYKIHVNTFSGNVQCGWKYLPKWKRRILKVKTKSIACQNNQYCVLVKLATAITTHGPKSICLNENIRQRNLHQESKKYSVQ